MEGNVKERTTITADHPLEPLSTRKLYLRGALYKEAVDLDNGETELKMHFTKTDPTNDTQLLLWLLGSNWVTRFVAEGME